MDEAARQVFSKNKQFIKQNLHLENGILDYLEAQSVLTPDCVESIQAERTNHDKISSLLLILQRKGPTAFERFLEALNAANTTFLADELAARYHEESENLTNLYNDTTSYEDTTSNSDEQTLEKVCQDTVPTEVSLNTKSLSVSISTYNNTRRRSSEHTFYNQPCLNNMYHKLKLHLFHMNERELSFGSPEPVTIEMVDELVDKLLKIEQDCFNVLRVVNRKSLLSHVIDLKEARKQLQKTIDNKEEQNKRYAGKIFKLDQKCRDLERALKTSEDRYNGRQEKVEELEERIEQLEEEKAAENLTTETSMKCISAENEQLKSKLAEYEVKFDQMCEKIKLLEENKTSYETVITSTPCHSDKRYAKTRKERTDIHSSHINENSALRHKPATLDDCKDICTSSDNDRLTKLRAKVLFAESVKTGGHYLKSGTNTEHKEGNVQHYTRVNKRHETVVDGTQQYDISESNNNVTENSKTNKSTETMVKLTEKYNKQSTLINGTIKTPFRTHRTFKRRPTWSRKPLK